MARRRRAVHLLVLAVFGSTLGTLAPVPSAPVAFAAEPPEGFEEPQAWIVVDAGTGRVLAGSNEHESLPPASLAKVMTALVAVERLPGDALIEVSELAASQPASKLGILPGEQYRLEDAIAAMMLDSANDMSYAVAETVGGDVEHFADLLDSTAVRYGMRESDFDDPAGLDDEDSFEGGPRMSAFDVAVMVRNARRAMPVAKWASTRDYAFDGPNARFELQNHNQMLAGGDEETEGVNGFKTGRTSLAGNTLAVTATRGNRTIITVVLNAPDASDTYAWSRYLLDVGFETPSDSDGTGEVLPATAVSVRAQRERDRDEFLALVTGEPIGSITSTTEAGTEVTPFQTPAPTTGIATSPTNSDTTSPSTASGNGGDGGGGGGVSVMMLVVVLVAGLTGALFARREQIKRRKRARARLRRQRAALMRRGSLPVVDGRYRTGMRTGNPPQAHIRLRRVDAPPEDDWEEWTGWDDEPPGPTRR